MDIKVIDQLVEAARRPIELAFGQRVNEFIGRTLDQNLTHYKSQSPMLRQVVIQELGSVLRQLQPDERAFFATAFDSVLRDVIKAAGWKIQMRAQAPDAIERWDENRRMDVVVWMDQLAQQPGDSYLKPLLSKLSREDQLRIAERTLRAIVHSVIQDDARVRSPMFVFHKERVCLEKKLVFDYLHDQIGLYVYQFLDRQAGAFLNEPCLKVRLYARKQLQGLQIMEADDLSKDIMAEVREDFLRKLNTTKTGKDSFFLDSLLSTYLLGFVNRGRLVWHAIKNQLAGDVSPDEIPILAVHDNDEQLKEVLVSCKQQLKPDCKEVIDSRYNNDYLRPLPASEIAADLDKGVKVVEGLIRRCLETLRTYVADECRRQHLIFSPR
ncbi:RNA polymerase sigma factor [Spirosoma validum]|uniref:Uncharacterized protein n=1 Tax=Spirosoma validum TaxID=2771355 RepID=A0A927B7J3_9BACT|nr:hypothetical protein [Spirosoma validum]MBD2756900.1 hypothetical protein [Spirosoma validum]